VTPNVRTPVGPPGGRDVSATATFQRPPARPEPPAIDEGSRTVLWLALGGAAVGVGVLAVGAWLFLGGDDDSGRDRATRSTTTAASAAAGALPPCPEAATGELTLPAVEIGEGLAPTRLEVEVSGDGTAATIRWDDPNAGRNPYLVFASCDTPDSDDRKAVAAVAAGEATEVTIGDLGLEHNYCFTVAVLDPDGTATAYTAQDGTHFRCLDQTVR